MADANDATESYHPDIDDNILSLVSERPLIALTLAMIMGALIARHVFRRHARPPAD
jgi:hypothetical protein